MHSADDKVKKPPKAKGASDNGAGGRDLSQALRQAYDDAVGETIPDDLLDLLKQLD